MISFTADDLREIYTFMGDLDGLAIRYASASPDQGKLQAEVTGSGKNVQLPKPLMCKPGTGIPTNSISFFTVTATTPDLQSPPNAPKRDFYFSNQYCRETVIQTRIDEEHLAIFQAYKDGDIEKAVQMMKTHLNDSLNYALRFYRKLLISYFSFFKPIHPFPPQKQIQENAGTDAPGQRVRPEYHADIWNKMNTDGNITYRNRHQTQSMTIIGIDALPDPRSTAAIQ